MIIVMLDWELLTTTGTGMARKSEALEKKIRLVVLASVIVLVYMLHFLVPTEPHSYHKLHIVLRKLYYLPPVIAAAWYGLRGAIYTTTIVSALFVGHAIYACPGNYME